MNLYDNYPTNNDLALFNKIEENVNILMFAFNKTAQKDPKALRKNIQYTVLLPILKSLNRSGEFDQNRLNQNEKKLLNEMLCNNTSIFTLGALLLHSKTLSKLIVFGFTTHSEKTQLLEFIDGLVEKNKKDIRCQTGVTMSDVIKISYIIAEVWNKHKLIENLSR